MLNGLDISGWTTVKDIASMVNGQLPIDIVYARAFDGFRDDAKFTQHRALLRTAKCANGSVLWGWYMFLGYTATVGSYNWKAVRGDYQAQNAWNLATAGGREDPLPPAIDIENLVFVDNGARQVVPMPDAYGYCDQYLMPAIKFLKAQTGRYPVLYTNADKLINYLAPMTKKPEFAEILQCPLWVAGWNRTMTQPPYWDKISATWKQWLIWQYAGDVTDWPGVNDVDLNRAQGTRAQWKAWLADSSKPMPSEGAAEPTTPKEPTEPTTPTTPTTGEYKAQLDRIEKVIGEVRSKFS